VTFPLGPIVEDALPTYVYALAESDTGDVRYVGQTVNPLGRLYTHRTGNSMLAPWVRDLRARGARVAMIVLRVVPAGDDADLAEHEELAARADLDLLNKRNVFGPARRHRAPSLRLIRVERNDSTDPQP
jgi:hypothetical protein